MMIMVMVKPKGLIYTSAASECRGALLLPSHVERSDQRLAVSLYLLRLSLLPRDHLI